MGEPVSITYDIAIAGCGPAGLSAAVALHDDGHRVSLYDSLAAPEPIGSGLLLQPTGLAVARSLGLESALRAFARRWTVCLGSQLRATA